METWVRNKYNRLEIQAKFIIKATAEAMVF